MTERLAQGVRRNKIADFIGRYCKEHGYCPTIREIGDAVDLKSTSTVNAHLKRLARDGVITYEPLKPRSIKLVERKKTSNRKQLIEFHCAFKLPKDCSPVGIVALVTDSDGKPLPPVQACKIKEEKAL